MGIEEGKERARKVGGKGRRGKEREGQNNSSGQENETGMKGEEKVKEGGRKGK